MATSVDWGNTKVITVPRADMTLLQASPEIRQLNVDEWRLELRALEDDVDGAPWSRTHDHTTDDVIQGVPNAPKVVILDPYTVTFEDGQYSVYLIGAINNILDKKNENQVSVNNSAAVATNVPADDFWRHPQASSITALNSRKRSKG